MIDKSSHKRMQVNTFLYSNFDYSGNLNMTLDSTAGWDAEAYSVVHYNSGDKRYIVGGYANNNAVVYSLTTTDLTRDKSLNLGAGEVYSLMVIDNSKIAAAGSLTVSGTDEGFMVKMTIDTSDGIFTVDGTAQTYSDVDIIKSFIRDSFKTPARYVAVGTYGTSAWIANINTDSLSIITSEGWPREYPDPESTFVPAFNGDITSICISNFYDTYHPTYEYHGYFIGTSTGYRYKLTPDADFYVDK
jgi:hypothetical protein